MKTLFISDNTLSSSKVIGSGSESIIYEYKESVIKYLYEAFRSTKDNLEFLSHLYKLEDTITLPKMEVYQDNEFIGFLMENAGINVRDYLLDHRTSESTKIAILRGIRNCLDKLHKYNLVHGDIKLENCLIKDNNIKICDINNLRLSGEENMYLNDMTMYLAKYLGFNKYLDIQSLNYYSYILLNLPRKQMREFLELGSMGYAEFMEYDFRNKAFDEAICEEQMDILFHPTSEVNPENSKYLIDYLKK